MRVVNKSRRS